MPVCCVAAPSACTPPLVCSLMDSGSHRVWLTRLYQLRVCFPIRYMCFAFVLQYCFRVEWPDKNAPSQASSVELGFDTLAQAQVGPGKRTLETLCLGHSTLGGCTGCRPLPPAAGKALQATASSTSNTSA